MIDKYVIWWRISVTAAIVVITIVNEMQTWRINELQDHQVVCTASKEPT